MAEADRHQRGAALQQVGDDRVAAGHLRVLDVVRVTRARADQDQVVAVEVDLFVAVVAERGLQPEVLEDVLEHLGELVLVVDD